jgi:hypothetical protein
LLFRSLQHCLCSTSSSFALPNLLLGLYSIVCVQPVTALLYLICYLGLYSIVSVLPVLALCRDLNNKLGRAKLELVEHRHCCRDLNNKLVRAKLELGFTYLQQCLCSTSSSFALPNLLLGLYSNVCVQPVPALLYLICRVLYYTLYIEKGNVHNVFLE